MKIHCESIKIKTEIHGESASCNHELVERLLNDNNEKILSAVKSYIQKTLRGELDRKRW